MAERNLIRLFPDGTSRWLRLGGRGSPSAASESGLPPAPADENILLLPAEDVLLIEAPRLARRASQLAQALPYAIEEQLAGAVEGQHVAFAEQPGSEQIAVAVVGSDRLRAALGRVEQAGIQVDRCYSIAQLLPVAAGQLSVLLEADSATLRWQRSASMSCRPAELADSIELLQAADVQSERIELWHSSPSFNRASLPAAAELRLHPVGDALAWLGEQLAAVSGPDLLQGEFRPRRRHHRISGQWRWAAGLAVAALLFGLLTLGLERAALERHTADRQQEMETLLRQAIPGTQRVVDPVAQLRAELSRRGGGAGDSGALALLAKVAPLIAGSGRYTIESLEYRAGTLELTISAPDVAALDGLRATLAGVPPLQVELTSALPGRNGYEGRLRIREGAA